MEMSKKVKRKNSKESLGVPGCKKNSSSTLNRIQTSLIGFTTDTQQKCKTCKYDSVYRSKRSTSKKASLNDLNEAVMSGCSISFGTPWVSSKQHGITKTKLKKTSNPRTSMAQTRPLEPVSRHSSLNQLLSLFLKKQESLDKTEKRMGSVPQFDQEGSKSQKGEPSSHLQDSQMKHLFRYPSLDRLSKSTLKKSLRPSEGSEIISKKQEKLGRKDQSSLNFGNGFLQTDNFDYSRSAYWDKLTSYTKNFMH